VKLSIVIPVRRATQTLNACVDSMRASAAGLDAEIVVAYAEGDTTAAIAAALTGVRLLPTKGQRSIPQLRRDGVRAARGEFILITEDHCTVAPDWARTLLAAAYEHPASAWGGPVRNGRTSWLGWAHYFTRYTAFLPPGVAGYTPHLPGNNALYRRDDLLSFATEWAEGFWEAEFNTVLRRERGPFWYAPAAIVTQRQMRGLFEYVSLRYRHGRCYGARCGKPHSAVFFFVAALLFWRGLRAAVLHGEAERFLAVAPLLMVYYSAWAAGEMVGFLAGPGTSCGDTD
jgi:glycosyltransferase involved in cell wall biosynthesis